ncbi:integral membrane protein [Zymoseptoria brevis]|uniref:Integral membrane protein n=1 Tax=Zymoseptoria brevis TaxID=1047168 RepID=A0A0F4GYW1_9PEZI|nr:integral membrane protein [Zymoseptoria brevis]
MALSLLHSTSLPLWHFSGLMSLFPLTLGLIGLVNPSNGFRLFNFPPPSGPSPSAVEGRKLATNLLLFWVSRDIYMAATCLAAYAGGSRTTMGLTYLAGAGVAICDGWMSHRQIGKDAWKHTMWVPVVVTMAGGLLGWFDRWV